MNIILWIVFGALAGWIASIIGGVDRQQGMVGNIVVGLIGALIGGAIMNIFGSSGITGFNLYSLLVAVLGAVILIFIFNGFQRGRV